jgi:hypothetical protein
MPPSQFGFLTASLDGRSFWGSFGPDSTVAIYNPEFGQLQIEGNRYDGDSSEVVRLQMTCEGTPEAGSYVVSASFFTPVSGGVFQTYHRRWMPRWMAVWRTRIHFLISDSVPLGVLELDTLDLESGAISGQFSFWVRTVNQKPVDRMFVTGAFRGRVRTLSNPQSAPVRFSPLMGRDCKGARMDSTTHALPMHAAPVGRGP